MICSSVKRLFLIRLLLRSGRLYIRSRVAAGAGRTLSKAGWQSTSPRLARVSGARSSFGLADWEQKEVAENDSGQALLPPVTLFCESYRNGEKGQRVRFWGYWVEAVRGRIEVAVGEFDDTDLSAHSDWQEAWQNEDPNYPHGFLDPLTMLHDVSQRITGEIDATVLRENRIRFEAGAAYPVNDLQDLAKLIQLLIPKALPKPPTRQNPPAPLDDDEADIPL